jgi:replicative DNA helicase
MSVCSGFLEHDQVAGRFLRGNMYAVASRPGVGKTSYAIAISLNLARVGMKVIYASLDNTIARLWNRLACLLDKSLTLKELNELENLTGETGARIEKLSHEIVKFSPWFFRDHEFGAFEKWVAANIEPNSDTCLIVDYAGRFTIKGTSPEHKFFIQADIARRLGNLATQLNIVVIVAVQTNRNVETRKEKRPLMSDLADTGDWERHARGIFMLSRDDNPSKLDVYVAKNTDEGPDGVKYSLSYDGPRSAVESWE